MIDEKLQEESWELLLEVMSLGERSGIDSDKLTLYHTKLLNLIASRVEEARIDELSDLRKELEMVPFDPTGTIGFDEHMIHRTKEEIQWARDKNRAHSIAAIALQQKIDKRLATLNNQSKGGEKGEQQ